MNKINALGSIITAFFILSFYSLSVTAQIEEIVVTATKRAESIQDVGLTITALDEKSYRELTGGTMDGLASQISNVGAYSTNSFLQSIHVRGIGLNEFQGQFDSPVATHFDEVYFSKPWMFARPLYDISRVEVLKGPQGTLFGRNTTGGAVNYYTNKPTDKYAANIELGFDEHERYSAQGMVNGPLSEDLSGRISFRGDFGSGGPQKNLFTGDEHGTPDLIDLRGQLLWENDKLTMRAIVHGGRDKSEKIAWKGPGIFNLGAPGFCPELFTGQVTKSPSTCPKSAGFAALNGRPEGEFEPEGKHTINQNTPPEVDDVFYGGNIRFDYEMGWGTLSSITAYEYFERRAIEDSQSDIFDSTSTHYYNKMNQFSQELRLTGQFTEKWRYVVGLFYEHDDLDQVDGSDLSEQQIPGILPPFADQFFAQFNTTTNSYALFAHNEYDLTDDITFNFGMRYTIDKIAANDAILGIGLLPQTGKELFVTPCLTTTFAAGPIGSAACPFLGATPPAFNDSRSDEDFSWRVGLEWKATDDTLVYGNITTGFRSGGYSLPFAGAATTFEPEELLAFELGFKSQLLDNTLQINASIFRYQYDDVQVNVDDPVSPLVPITRNIGEQNTNGAEADLTWQPTDRWTVRQAMGYLDAEFSNTTRSVTTYAGPIPLNGKRPVNAPKWTYNGVVRYEQPIFAGWNGILMTDYRWVDDRFLEATNQIFEKADSYWVVNMRAAIASQDGKWEVAVWGKNLFDKEYLTYVNNIGFFKLDIFGEQRTFGANIRYNFE
jgi:iron complex outermembrane receptor protein